MQGKETVNQNIKISPAGYPNGLLVKTFRNAMLE